MKLYNLLALCDFSRVRKETVTRLSRFQQRYKLTKKHEVVNILDASGDLQTYDCKQMPPETG